VGRTHVSLDEYSIRSLIIDLTGFLFLGPQLYESAHAQGNPPSDRAETDRQPALHSIVRAKTDSHQLGDWKSDQQTQRCAFDFMTNNNQDSH